MFSRLFSGGTTMASCLSAVAEQLLRDIHREYSEKGQIPDDLLIALRFVFGSCVLHALDLVDRRAVTCVSSPSGRVAFQVLGGSGHLYTCYTSCHFCPCPAFAFSVLRRNESLVNGCVASPWSTRPFSCSEEKTHVADDI
ncbi:zinc finger SWIM domain-containing protein 7 isoform X3 [Electrophorus electricus]|uniref:zinc finger SWIM domain-containing protein 7 isoform X3 n=1 Tax=Electrophorus electricus TaxID=8005 RepID=UPI0015D043B9|nr:zinc finger SWIM domain-containing protein 7 isoform X3 [Electrophorus electricus]